jgi:hypothetical protein
MTIAPKQRWVYSNSAGNGTNSKYVAEILSVTAYSITVKIVQIISSYGRYLGEEYVSDGLLALSKGSAPLGSHYWTYLEGQDAS